MMLVVLAALMSGDLQSTIFRQNFCKQKKTVQE